MENSIKNAITTLSLTEEQYLNAKSTHGRLLTDGKKSETAQYFADTTKRSLSATAREALSAKEYAACMIVGAVWACARAQAVIERTIREARENADLITVKPKA